MAQCTWCALIRDKETYFLDYKYFRYESFAPEHLAKEAFQREYCQIYEVVEVTKDPYKYRNFLRGNA